MMTGGTIYTRSRGSRGLRTGREEETFFCFDHHRRDEGDARANARYDTKRGTVESSRLERKPNIKENQNRNRGATNFQLKSTPRLDASSRA